MSITIGPGYNVAAPSGAASVTVQGNGAVYHYNGQLFGREQYAVQPLAYLDGDGIGGPPILTMKPSYILLGQARINGTITDDQPIYLSGHKTCIIDRIHFRGASTTPAAIRGGIYTGQGKTGDVILPSNTSFAGLTGSPYTLVVKRPVEADALRAVDILYFSASIANVEAFDMDVLIYGFVDQAVDL